MRLTERSYSGKIIRPRPVVHVEPEGSLILVSTSWGEPGAAAVVNEEITKYVQAALADVEVTSPYEFISSLTDEANYLRVATLIINERLYRSDNRNEYVAGVETLALFKKDSQLAYVKVGGPHMLIQKAPGDVLPVLTSLNLNRQVSDGLNLVAPLPQELLGADLHVNLQAGHFRVEDEDQIFLYAGSYFPSQLWNELPGTADVNTLAQKLASSQPEAPFWLGRVQLFE